MNIMHKLTVDLANRNCDSIIKAVRGDSSRMVEITVLSDGSPWQIPEDASIVIRYAKPDGTTGTYDTLPDGTRAWQATGNLLTVSLAPQLFTVSGAVSLQITVVQGLQQISTFRVALDVSTEISSRSGSADYTNLSQWLAEYGGNGGYFHVRNFENPHRVTAAQVGLDRVNNTADDDKPISAAMKSALNQKASKTELSVERARIDSLVSAPPDADASVELIDLRVGVSGTTYASAGAAVRGQLRELHEYLDFNDLNTFRNLLDPALCSVGMIDETLQLQTWGAYANYLTSGFIPVVPGKTYLLRYRRPDTNNRLVITEYTADQSALSPQQNVDEVNELQYQPRSNARFVRISHNKADNVQFCLEQYRDAYQPYGGLKGRVDALESTLEAAGIINHHQNLLNPADCAVGAWDSDGNYYTHEAYAFYLSSKYIAVTPNTAYVLRYEQDYTRDRLIVKHFDEDKNAVDYHNLDEVNRIAFTTGPKTRYVMVSFRKEHTAQFSLEKYADRFYPYGGQEINWLDLFGDSATGALAFNVLRGKKYVACGDSFTDCGYTPEDGFDESVYRYQDGPYAGRGITYPFIIGLRNDMQVVNLAMGGMTMAVREGSNNNFSSAVYKNIPADADYITIKLGINDDNYQTPVGSIDDTDNATFYGAWNTVMAHILANHPLAKVGIIVTNGSAPKYTDATVAIAKKWGVPYLDEVNDPKVPLLHRADRPGVAPEVKAAKLAAFRVSDNNTHPNTQAQYYEASFVEEFLRSL